MNPQAKMSPTHARKFVAFGAETSRTAGEVASGLPMGMKDSLPEGWDWERVLGLCTAAVAPEGPEPALVSYAEPADLLEGGSSRLADPCEPLARGAMLLTTHSTVRRRKEGRVIRHRKARHGLVINASAGGPVEVLWSPWSHEEVQE